jgi:hypothetical protein
MDYGFMQQILHTAFLIFSCHSNTCVDTVDGPGRDPELRPFSSRSRSLIIFTAKNANMVRKK